MVPPASAAPRLRAAAGPAWGCLSFTRTDPFRDGVFGHGVASIVDDDDLVPFGGIALPGQGAEAPLQLGGTLKAGHDNGEQMRRHVSAIPAFRVINARRSALRHAARR